MVNRNLEMMFADLEAWYKANGADSIECTCDQHIGHRPTCALVLIYNKYQEERNGGAKASTGDA